MSLLFYILIYCINCWI